MKRLVVGMLIGLCLSVPAYGQKRECPEREGRPEHSRPEKPEPPERRPDKDGWNPDKDGKWEKPDPSTKPEKPYDPREDRCPPDRKWSS